MAGAVQTKSGVIAAGGTATLSIRPDNRRTWTVQQVTLDAPNVGTSATARVELNGNLITPCIPQADAPSGEPFITVHPGDTFSVKWAASTVGATVKATFIYDDGT